jgi:hypothetical protein
MHHHDIQGLFTFGTGPGLWAVSGCIGLGLCGILDANFREQPQAGVKIASQDGLSRALSHGFESSCWTGSLYAAK